MTNLKQKKPRKQVDLDADNADYYCKEARKNDRSLPRQVNKVLREAQRK